MTAGTRTTVPVDVGRDEAREAARQELADPVYSAAEPGLLERALDWALTWLDELLSGVATATPGGVVGLVVLAVLVLAVVVGVRLRVGRLARSAAVKRPVFDLRPRTAAEYRAAAEQAAAAGEFAAAVRERFRAVARGLEERGVLDERPGRTADEVAADAGARLATGSGCAPALLAAARTFDEVIYGGRPAGAAAYEQLVDTDQLVGATGPVPVRVAR